ncbi:MAG TPA: hypothetical protein PLE30_10340 [Candidatus Kapabacteria bacterium]|nr:hypothetical protein [Candidatus Kapabacteria bacterium]
MKSKILMLIGSLILVSAFFVPLWTIDLIAPQYPEGLGLYIHLNKIEGHKEGDLQSINGLNHYIGMKEIKPESIPELTIIPYFMYFMIALGLVTVVFNKKWMKMAWIGIFAVGGIVGLYDFYMWEYDYGHNLDPHAIIKIPGMNYQPPLIGYKQLLNFEAGSWPHFGFVIIMVSVLLVLCSLYLDFKNDKKLSKVT